MRTLVEMLIFILFLKVSSKLFNDQHFCSPHSVVLQFYIVLLACINQFDNKICRVGDINRVGRGSGNSTFLFLGLSLKNTKLGRVF